MTAGLPLRLAARSGRLAGPTGSLAPGLAQANLALIPAALAGDFAAFLRANPAAFPLLAQGRPGDPGLPELGEGIDLRSDLPRYRIFQHGVFVLLHQLLNTRDAHNETVPIWYPVLLCGFDSR